MAGAYEISKTVSRILENPRSNSFDVFALHGDLPPERQDKILANTGRRKVIVSTNVAETSLTIEGVRVVIDSGQARVARFDSARGVNTLLCEIIMLPQQ
jgi:ATP-dependent helicase HrpB